MAASWTITGDLPDQYSTVNSAVPVLGHQMSLITGAGHRGSFFVPNDHYVAATVKHMAQIQADLVDEINSLSHTA